MVPSDGISISCLTGQGIPELSQLIEQKLSVIRGL